MHECHLSFGLHLQVLLAGSTQRFLLARRRAIPALPAGHMAGRLWSSDPAAGSRKRMDAKLAGPAKTIFR